MTDTTMDAYITHPAVVPKLDEAVSVAIRYINMEMSIRPCVEGCESFDDLNDFTDANEYLIEAFMKVVRREPHVGLEPDIMFLNETARRLDLWLKIREVRFTEEMAVRLVTGIENGTVDELDIMALVLSAQDGTLPSYIREQPAFR